MSKLLADLGWLLLASDRGKTELGHADTAVLVDTSGFGGEQKLWMAEPLESTPKASRANTQHSVRPVYWSDASNNSTATGAPTGPCINTDQRSQLASGG